MFTHNMEINLPQHFFDKLFITTCLLIAIYYTLNSTSKILLENHQFIFYSMIVLPFSFIFYRNYFNIT